MKQQFDQVLSTLGVPAILEQAKRDRVDAAFERYEELWGQPLKQISKMIDSGEKSLSRVLELSVVERHRQEVFTNMVETYWLGKPRKTPAGVAYDQRRALKNGLLHRACTPETDSIVELGSGLAVHLFWFWLAGGPRNARYLALELSATARRSIEALAKLEPALRMSTHPYDFMAPDYSAIPNGQRHMVVFSSMAVKEAAILPREAITGLLDKAEKVTGMHWEPVGWQFCGPEDEEERQQGIRNAKRGYNENLWPLLKELESEGRIVIEDARNKVMGSYKRLVAHVQWRKAT